jgi:hypothetical protein
MIKQQGLERERMDHHTLCLRVMTERTQREEIRRLENIIRFELEKALDRILGERIT